MGGQNNETIEQQQEKQEAVFYSMYHVMKMLKKFTSLKFTIINHNELLGPIIRLTIVYELYVILLAGTDASLRFSSGSVVM